MLHFFANSRTKKLFKFVAVFLVLILLPLVVAYAAAPAKDSTSVAGFAAKVLAAGPILLVGGLVSAYVNLLGLLALQMVNLLIKLAQFNNFVDFAPVVTGWTIIRDVVNMSFIIVLLVIAISTILGYEAYSYRRLLPRLVLMAVLINFSRTIIGLLIDVGQVFMLTFVNAFAGAAGGNFIDALKVNDLLSLGVKETFTQDVSPLNIFRGYILAAIAITVVFIVMLTFVGVLIFRILTLWFLTVFSPLAFAVSAWPSAKANKYYGQWWNQLTSNIISGPILAFFLWLALLMMSADYVSVLAPGISGVGDATGAVPNPAGVTQLSAPETFASFLFGIATLLMALKMTQSLGVGFASFGSQALSFAKQKATSLAKGTGRLALFGAGAGVGAVAGAAVRRAGVGEGTPIKEGALSVLSNVPVVRDWARGQLGKSRAERTKIFGEQGSKQAELTWQEKEKVAGQRPPILTPNIAAKRSGQLYNFLTDKNFARELEKNYGAEKADAKMKDYMKEYMQVTKVAPTPEITRKAIDIKNFRPDLLEPEEFTDHVERMDPEDIKKISPSVFTRAMERPEMPAETKYRFLEAAEKGNFGLQKAAKEYRDKNATEAMATGGEIQNKFFEQQETEFKTKKYEERLRAQDIGEDDVSNPLIVRLLVTDPNFSGELTAVLKREDTRKPLRDTLLAMKSNLLQEDAGKVTDNGQLRYADNVLAMSENAVLAGAKLEQAYNLNPKTASFTEEIDRNSYQKSLAGQRKIDIILKTEVGAIKKNEFDNEVAKSIVLTLKKDDMADLVTKAGKDPAAQQNVADVVSVLRQEADANNSKAKEIVEEIDNNPVLYQNLLKISQSGRKEKRGGSPSGNGGGSPAGGEGGTVPPTA